MPKKPTPPPPPAPAKTPPGPTPDTLKLAGDWQANVKRSLTKKKPAGGWPKPDGNAK